MPVLRPRQPDDPAARQDRARRAAFDLINVDGSHGGTGSQTLADWILHGLDAYMALGGYYSDAGAKWNSSQIGNALDQRIGTELLFPVYDTLTGTGANATYHVIGWVGFHLTAHTEQRQQRHPHRLVHRGRLDRDRRDQGDRRSRPRRPRSSNSSTDPQLKDKEQWHTEHETS